MISGKNDTVQQDMTRAEQKRQHVIQELISTEESYNADMQTALEVMSWPKNPKKFLSLIYYWLIFVEKSQYAIYVETFIT